MMFWKLVTIKSLPLSVRANHVCRNGRIETLGDLWDKCPTLEDFLTIKNSGITTALEMHFITRDFCQIWSDNEIDLV